METVCKVCEVAFFIVHFFMFRSTFRHKRRKHIDINAGITDDVSRSIMLAQSRSLVVFFLFICIYTSIKTNEQTNKQTNNKQLTNEQTNKDDYLKVSGCLKTPCQDVNFELPRPGYKEAFTCEPQSTNINSALTLT